MLFEWKKIGNRSVFFFSVNAIWLIAKNCKQGRSWVWVSCISHFSFVSDRHAVLLCIWLTSSASLAVLVKRRARRLCFCLEYLFSRRTPPSYCVRNGFNCAVCCCAGYFTCRTIRKIYRFSATLLVMTPWIHFSVVFSRRTRRWATSSDFTNNWALRGARLFCWNRDWSERAPGNVLILASLALHSAEKDTNLILAAIFHISVDTVYQLRRMLFAWPAWNVAIDPPASWNQTQAVWFRLLNRRSFFLHRVLFDVLL